MKCFIVNIEIFAYLLGTDFCYAATTGTKLKTYLLHKNTLPNNLKHLEKYYFIFTENVVGPVS